MATAPSSGLLSSKRKNGLGKSLSARTCDFAGRLHGIVVKRKVMFGRLSSSRLCLERDSDRHADSEQEGQLLASIQEAVAAHGL